MVRNTTLQWVVSYCQKFFLLLLSLKLSIRLLVRKSLGKLVDDTFRIAGAKETVLIADALRSMGYRYSTKAGLSISVGDMVIPEGKDKLLDGAYEEVLKIKEQYSEGLLTEGERYNKVVDIWAKVTEGIAEKCLVTSQKKLKLIT